MSEHRRSSHLVEDLPVGDPVPHDGPAGRPSRADYDGAYVTLASIGPERDVASLYALSHGTALRETVWTYLPYGPFEDVAEMTRWLEQCAAAADPMFFVVIDRASDVRIGMVSFLNIETDSRCVELGHIWYAADYQRKSANTEAVYLMLEEAFGRRQYRRVEWKCDALNHRSRVAALRLGFRYEGLFRQHRIVKGRNRDTAWFSMLDGEWPQARETLRRWLDWQGDSRPSLAELRQR